ncbi:hypothetical protein GCM10009111_25630 [Colwellia asteriadis]|uniref:Uncharacterized protein n=1 Tax=Colwellia asteriadis TaxID=517723 RepID=A0ABN1L8Y3_9GAMM
MKQSSCLLIVVLLMIGVFCQVSAKGVEATRGKYQFAEQLNQAIGENVNLVLKNEQVISGNVKEVRENSVLLVLKDKSLRQASIYFEDVKLVIVR